MLQELLRHGEIGDKASGMRKRIEDLRWLRSGSQFGLRTNGENFRLRRRTDCNLRHLSNARTTLEVFDSQPLGRYLDVNDWLVEGREHGGVVGSNASVLPPPKAVGS